MGTDRASILLALVLLSAKALGNPLGSVINETETDADDFYLEDALGKWLGNFDTYTFMVEQDVDDDDEGGAGGEEPMPEGSSVLDEGGEFMEEEEEVEDYDQGSSAPIVLVVKKGDGLLNPDMDYKVKLESLVAEEGSVLVTLGTFGNSTTCGVGGFSLPPETEEREVPVGRLDISHHQEGNRSTTFVAFARGVDPNIHKDEHSNTTASPREEEHSDWKELSQNLWWSTGRLTGGGLLTLVYTPPECGCLTLKAYYALPIGDNLTLVVGPEAYPADLEKLICVDPSSHSIQDNLIEDEYEDTDEDPSEDALEDSNPPQEEEEEKEEKDNLGSPGAISGQARRGRGRWATRKRAKLDRKKLRQKARQAIRRAGRRVGRQNSGKHLRMRRRDDLTEEEEGTTRQPGVQRGAQDVRRERRKQARKEARKQMRKGKKSWKGKKPWKKHRQNVRKNGRRNKHNRRNRNHRHHNVTGDVTPSPEEALEDSLLEEDDHFNTTELNSEDEELANFLMGEDEDEEEAEGELETTGVHGTVTDEPGHRRFRDRRRQRGKAGRKLKNKDHRKGANFCCKQGIKYKKGKLVFNNTVEEDYPEIACDDNEIVVTFATHQYAIESTQCADRYETCCSKFTLQLWENHKGKKAAKKAKRKQQRKAARQNRRRTGRRHRFSTTTPTTPLSVTP